MTPLDLKMIPTGQIFSRKKVGTEPLKPRRLVNNKLAINATLPNCFCGCEEHTI